MLQGWKNRIRIASVFLALLVLGTSASAQFYYFGRNKVQWTSFDWRILKTDHFEIYFYAGAEELARRGAAYAEEAYQELEQRFNHNVLEPIPLIFYSSHLHFQQTNTIAGFIPEGVGGFFEFLKGRVVIPSDGSPAQFRHVIRHELVHVFTHAKLSRVLADHRIAMDRMPPLWFTEGLAEFWSTEWDTQADMVLRDAVVNNYAVPVEEMERIYGTFLMYKEGQHICAFIAERYGEEKLLLLLENFWRSATFSEVMKETIDRTYEEFDREWMYALKKQYYPLMATEDLPSGVARTLMEEGFNAKPVVYGADSSRGVYYIGNRAGYTSIYRLDPDAAKPEPELIIEGENSSELEAFHPFQSKLAVSRGGMLAFVTKSGETDVFHLLNLRSRSIERTLRFASLVVLGSPTWSPEGNRLSFTAIDRSGANDLYIYDLRDSALLRITADVYDDRDPAWSPDGKWITFSSDRTSFGENGTQNLFVYNVETGSIEYLTSGPHSDRSPAWSPDGKYLAFTSDRSGSQNIWLGEFADGAFVDPLRRLTSFVTAATDPAWGGRDDLVFTVFERFSFQIRSIDGVAARYDSSSHHATAIDALPGERWIPPAFGTPDQARAYRSSDNYSVDIAQSQISTDPIFGTAGGAALAMSDVLGNDQYYFLLYNTASVQSEFLDNFNVAITRISLGKRTNYAYGIFRLAGNRYDLTDPDLYYYERSFGGYFVLSYPLSKFDRLESGVTVSTSQKDVFVLLAPRRALLVSNSLSYVWDTSLWGPNGPLDGNRVKLLLAYTNDIQNSKVNYYTVIADVRNYQRLGIRSALASRAHLLYNEGREARRFFMGGSWDLRGWDRWSIRGKKQWLTSHELRFPFIDVLGLRFPFGSVGFGPIGGALFFDAGGSWDDAYRDTKGSLGGGIRLSLFGAFVLRYDIGKRIEQNFTKLQRGLFYQFFFGWDF